MRHNQNDVISLGKGKRKRQNNHHVEISTFAIFASDAACQSLEKVYQ